MQRSLSSAAFAVITLGLAGIWNGASAAPSATIGSQSASPTDSTATSSFVTPDVSSAGQFILSTSGSSPGVQASPFVNNLDYSVLSAVLNGVASPADSGSAVYNITAGVTSISVLWGSPDAYNSVIFFTGAAGTNGLGTGTVVATFTGSSLTAATPGAGYDLVTFDISGVSSVEFVDNGQAAFEYADLNLDPAPLPAALPLFASGLFLIGLFTWRRKNKALAIAATA
jgi:hypothetical protein